MAHINDNTEPLSDLLIKVGTKARKYERKLIDNSDKVYQSTKKVTTNAIERGQSFYYEHHLNEKVAQASDKFKSALSGTSRNFSNETDSDGDDSYKDDNVAVNVEKTVPETSSTLNVFTENADSVRKYVSQVKGLSYEEDSTEDAPDVENSGDREVSSNLVNGLTLSERENFKNFTPMRMLQLIQTRHEQARNREREDGMAAFVIHGETRAMTRFNGTAIRANNEGIRTVRVSTKKTPDTIGSPAPIEIAKRDLSLVLDSFRNYGIFENPVIVTVDARTGGNGIEPLLLQLLQLKNECVGVLVLTNDDALSETLRPFGVIEVDAWGN